MKRVTTAIAVATILAGCAPSRTPPPPSGRIVVYAAASLSEAFDAVAGELREQDFQVRAHYAGSHQLAARIRQGETPDLFAPADDRWMEDMVREEIISVPEVFARNRLVVILPLDNPGRIERLEDLARPRVRVVLGAEAVPIGRYARMALERLARQPDFGEDFDERVLANVVSQEDDVKAVAAKVQLREADAGIVYQTDLTSSVTRDVRTLTLPEEANVEVTLSIAVLRRGANPRGARAFVAFLRSPRGQALLAERGFLPPAPTP
jgi:molybdate transport system substrate-binding protein